MKFEPVLLRLEIAGSTVRTCTYIYLRTWVVCRLFQLAWTGWQKHSDAKWEIAREREMKRKRKREMERKREDVSLTSLVCSTVALSVNVCLLTVAWRCCFTAHAIGCGTWVIAVFLTRCWVLRFLYWFEGLKWLHSFIKVVVIIGVKWWWYCHNRGQMMMVSSY